MFDFLSRLVAKLPIVYLSRMLCQYMYVFHTSMCQLIACLKQFLYSSEPCISLPLIQTNVKKLNFNLNLIVKTKNKEGEICTRIYIYIYTYIVFYIC